MTRYVAFLRGIGPLTAKMTDLKRAFEAAGFTRVKTVLGSGNVVFDSDLASEAEVERIAEAAMERKLGRSFFTIARPVAALEKLLSADPFRAFDLPSDAKRVVTFVRDPVNRPKVLPIERDGARILATKGREVFTAYVRNSAGPVFMKLIEENFGRDVTTRTWETVRKCVAA